jgi:hypothetical protein
METQKRIGRPTLPKYRGKLHRFGKIEDKIVEILPLMKSQHDRKLVLNALEELKK